MKREIGYFLLALSYFTRIPVREHAEFTQDGLDRSMCYFPYVGYLIGLLSMLVYVSVALVLPKEIAILSAMTVSTGLTGGFHEDGLADCYDGLGSTFDRDSALRIMKDSRLGTYGALALMYNFALKFFSLYHLPDALIPAAILCAHGISRFFALSLTVSMDYVRQGGSANNKAFASHVSRARLIVAGLTVLPLFLFTPVYASLFCIVVLFVFRRILIVYFTHRLGGYTGDVLGASQQGFELLLIICILGSSVFQSSL